VEVEKDEKTKKYNRHKSQKEANNSGSFFPPKSKTKFQKPVISFIFFLAETPSHTLLISLTPFHILSNQKSQKNCQFLRA
jgi:hypothetical protein